MGYSVLGTTAARFNGNGSRRISPREIAEVCYRFVRGAEDTAGSIQHSLKKGDQTENHSHKNRVKDEKGLKKKLRDPISILSLGHKGEAKKKKKATTNSKTVGGVPIHT